MPRSSPSATFSSRRERDARSRRNLAEEPRQRRDPTRPKSETITLTDLASCPPPSRGLRLVPRPASALRAPALVATALTVIAAAVALAAPAIATASPAKATPAKATASRARVKARPVAAPPTPAQELAQQLARTAAAPKTKAPTPVLAPGPLVWQAPTGIDAQPIDGLACPSISLCVAVDNNGRALSSIDPSGPARTWRSADIDASSSLAAVSCPSVSTCVAVDAFGNALTTGTPTGPGTGWTVAKVDSSITEPSPYGGGPDLLRGLSCPSVSFCVAVDSVGNVVSSTDPTGGPTAWVIAHVDTNSDYGCTTGGLTCQAPLMGVSCPNPSLCGAVDFTGNILATTTPAGPSPWASRPIGGSAAQSLWSVSCPTTSFCATVDGIGGNAITWNPVRGTLPTKHRLGIDAFGIWCSSTTLCLASGETPNNTAELLGTTNPTAKSPKWTVTDYGDINAISCPTTSACLAADNQGAVILGVTVKSLTATLRRDLATRVPRLGVVVRSRGYAFPFVSPLAGQLQIKWAASKAARAPVLATASAQFTGPGTQAVRLTLTSAGTRLLKAAKRRIAVRAIATYQTNTGMVSSNRRLTIRSKR